MFCGNSPLLKNNGFGEGLFAMSFLLMQTLLPPATATASTRSTGLPFLFLLPFSFAFTFPILFSFPFSFFIFLFFSFLFLFSYYFFIFLFYFFISSLSFPHLIFLVALLQGARKGIINSYQHFY
jgi:hypothetical protein